MPFFRRNLYPTINKFPAILSNAHRSQVKFKERKLDTKIKFVCAGSYPQEALQRCSHSDHQHNKAVLHCPYTVRAEVFLHRLVD